MPRDCGTEGPRAEVPLSKVPGLEVKTVYPQTYLIPDNNSSSFLVPLKACYCYRYMILNGKRNLGKNWSLFSQADKYSRACKTTSPNPPVQADGVMTQLNIGLNLFFIEI